MIAKFFLSVDVIIPAHNEERSIALVIQELPKKWIREIVVVNNNSSDNTRKIAKKAGATVIDEWRYGYGQACQSAIEYLEKKKQSPDVVVFIDGDYSDYPSELPTLLQPILASDIDLVIGSRTLGERAPKSMNLAQICGNWLAVYLIALFYGAKFTDLGPFRAIKFQKLLLLEMQDKNYGWTVEMQIKAVQKKLTYKEVAVNYRARIGFSKISGTFQGILLAGYKIITTIFYYRKK